METYFDRGLLLVLMVSGSFLFGEWHESIYAGWFLFQFSLLALLIIREFLNK